MKYIILLFLMFGSCCRSIDKDKPVSETAKNFTHECDMNIGQEIETHNLVLTRIPNGWLARLRFRDHIVFISDENYCAKQR